MASFRDIISGKIAVALGYITNEQLEQIMKELEAAGAAGNLGTILLQKNLIDDEKLRTIQAKAREEQDRHDTRFARVALSLAILSKENLDQAKQLQESKYPEKPLRTVLLENGILTAEQAQSVTEALKGAQTLLCPKCQKQYTQTSYQQGKSYKCPECNVDLRSPSEQRQAEDGKMVFLSEEVSRHETPAEMVLTGAAQGLDMKLPEEKEDEMCGKRVGDYLILKRLGSGAMGVVYKAEQIKLRRVVALKTLSARYAADSFYIKRFMIEARSAAKLNHPHILQVYDVDSYEGGFFFSMEFINGESIGGVLDRMKKIPVSNTMDIAIQITQGLMEMYDHKIVHRDIKPDNIMLTTKGVAKLADLGLAKNVDYAKEETGLIMGTPFYISPEQISAPKTVDYRADIYSLGACLYRMMTGVVPFLHPDPRIVLTKVTTQNLPPASSVNSLIPHSVSWVLEKMMQKDPKERFATPLELLEILKGTQAQLSGQSQQGLSKPALRNESIKIEVGDPIDTTSFSFQEEPPDPSLLQALHGEEPQVPADAAMIPTTRRTLEKKKTAEAAHTPKKSEDASAPRRPFRQEQAPQKSRFPKSVIVVAVALLAIIGYSFKSDSGPAEPEVKPPTIDELRAQAFQPLDQKVHGRNAQDAQQLSALLQECDAFHRQYPGSEEGQKIQERMQAIQSEIEALERQKQADMLAQYYRDLKNKVENSRAQKEFVRAVAELNPDIHAAYPQLKTQLEGDIEETKRIASADCGDFLKEIEILEQKVELQEAIGKLDQFWQKSQNSQFPENLQRIAAEKQDLEGMLCELKRILFVLEIQGALSEKVAIGDLSRIKPYLAHVATPPFQDKFAQDFPAAGNYLGKLKQELFPVEVSALEKEFQGLAEWVDMSFLDDKLKEKAAREKLKGIKLKFEFTEGKPVEGFLVSVSKGSIMIQSQGNSLSKKIERLTWNNKWQLIETLIEKKVIEETDALKYQKGLIFLALKDFAKARQDLEKFPHGQARFLMALFVRIQELMEDRNVKDLEAFLAKYRHLYRENPLWASVQYYYARMLYEAGERAPENPEFYRILIENFRQFLFAIEFNATLVKDLNYGELSEDLETIFGDQGYPLAAGSTVSAKSENREWSVDDGKSGRVYSIIKEGESLKVYSSDATYYGREARKKYRH